VTSSPRPAARWLTSTAVATTLACLLGVGFAHAEPGTPPTPAPSPIPTAPATGPVRDTLLPTPQEASNIPGVTGLLPWPSNLDIPTLTGPEEKTDGESGDYTVASVDQAVVLYETIQRENTLASTTAALIPPAMAAAAAAHASSQEATRAALLTRAESATAQQKMDGTIRGIYMSGGVPSVAEVFFAADGQTAYDMLITNQQVVSAANYLVNDAIRMQGEASDADAGAILAMQQATTADAAVTQLQDAATAHQKAAQDAATAYVAYMTAEGPQVQVGSDGCPTTAPSGVLREGAELIGVTALCQKSVMLAATPQAALAIKWAFSRLGAPYACKGIGRMGAFRFDCSSLVSRAYWEGAGVPVATDTSAPSTRNMMPWDGISLDPHYQLVAPADVMPGDLILTRSCTSEPCIYQHVTMALADGFILETNSCGDVAHVRANAGYGPDTHFVVARRVILLDGESIPSSLIGTADPFAAVEFPASETTPVTPDQAIAAP
jgi:cell wall-associated NlpC family hydrolase